MRCLLVSFAILCLFTSQAQDFKSIYKVVPIMSDQKFYLNGGARADFGGKSRAILEINLPPNTVEWYYAITSSPNQGQTQSIGLAAQLIRLLAPEEGMLASAVAKLISPTGAGVCDVYLIQDQISENDFIAKKGQFTYDLTGTRQNFREGVVRVKDALKGPYILGIRNPSAMEGINIGIEVAAIVAARVPVSKSPSQDEATLYNEIGQKAYADGEYDKCIEYEKKAMSLDSTLCSAATNLALACLVACKSEALDNYVKAVELMKQSTAAKKWLSDAIRDLDEAKQKFSNLKDFDIVKNLLLTEYEKH